MLFALFLSLHALLVRIWFGNHTVLFTLLFLVFPGWRVLWWTFRPIGPYAAMFVLGTIILLLGTRQFRKPSFHPIRLCLLGFVIGLALWTHQMTVPYTLSLGAAFVLQSAEWKALYAKGEDWSTRRFGKAAVLLPICLILGLLFLFTLSFFSSSCSPPELFALARTVSRLTLVLAAGVLLAAFLVISCRRKSLFRAGIFISGGAILGIAPLWVNALRSGTLPSPALWPSCPAELPERVSLLTRELLPGLFGLPTATELPNVPLPQMILATAIALLIGSAAVCFAWRQRHALASLLTLYPLPRFEPAMIPASLLIIPITLAVLGSNTVDSLSIRYLLVSWQAGAIILGIFLAAMSRRSSRLTTVLVALCVFHFAIVNLRHAHQFWETRYNRFSTALTRPLEEMLSEVQVTAGYGDYWTVYALDFLLEERVILAPYNGMDRYPPYTAHVAAQPRIALILSAPLLPESVSSIPEVQEVLSGFTGAGPAFPQFHDDIANRRLQQRFQAGRWEVWILEK
jgi:hypothetical protein